MMSIQCKIDEKKLSDSINDAINLDDNELMFKQLSLVESAKNELKDAIEKIESIESVAKGLINSKAKQLYGDKWQTIAGSGYKITRSPTGSVYIRNPDLSVNKKFIEIKESLKTKEIELDLEKTGKLPKGVEVNPKRGESIRITIK